MVTGENRFYRPVIFGRYEERMSGGTIIKFVNPWKFRRDQAEQRVTALRHRDGDNCRRCKRPLRFDLPDGHDLRARIEAIVPKTAGGSEELDNLCLTHGRCNGQAGDDTADVQERVRLKSEAALFEASRKKRRRA
jgi:5-methylcytosine-specific restriction endonuclease McrA